MCLFHRKLSASVHTAVILHSHRIAFVFFPRFPFELTGSSDFSSTQRVDEIAFFSNRQPKRLLSASYPQRNFVTCHRSHLMIASLSPPCRVGDDSVIEATSPAA